MGSITIHNIAPDLEKCIRAAALENRVSLNKLIQKKLREAFDLEAVSVKKSDFSDLAGSWSEDDAREFEEVTKDFSAIDEEMWK